MMSIQSDSPNSEASGSKSLEPLLPAKKRRTPGACDNCKRKKIRCDSAEKLGNRCSNCVQLSLECTHKEVSKALGPAKGYVESLEARLEKMEKLLNKLLPMADLTKELEGLEEVETPTEFPLLPRNDDGILEEELVGKMRSLHVDPPQGRFFGKSSGYQLVQTALDIRGEYIGKEKNRPISAMKAQRSEYWTVPPWHPSRYETPEPPKYTFPDDDLITPLVDAYFTQINPFYPLLHRPSFDKSLADNLHHRDTYFGGTVLLVCALGSRYSDDPRILYPGRTSLHSAGWRWFEQVEVVRKSFVAPPSLGELRNHALHVLFAQTTETPQGCWTQLGMALRMAQEVGAHRRRTLKAPTAEDEQWKRVFWVLWALDSLVSSMSGRPCVFSEEDYDVDRPIECDDEYWDHPDPSLAFQQPPNKPSTITYFNSYLGLMDILSRAMKVIYSVKKCTKSVPYLNQKIIMDLDSAMNSWMDSVPDHLRWNASSNNELFLKQSATLYATYYHLQIFIHRPFIPSFRNPSSTTFPSLAICTNAARSCCHVLEVQTRTSFPPPGLQATIFTAAVVLLLNIWSGKRCGVAPNPQREIDDVQRCLNMLKTCEKRWCSAGRYWDVLQDLATAGDLPFSDSSTSTLDSSTGHKRPRDCDTVAGAQTDTWFNDIPKDQRKVAGSRRVSVDQPDFSPPVPQPQTLNYDLPMYATELGRLPVYGQFKFSESHKRPRHDSSSGGNSSFTSPLLEGETNFASYPIGDMGSMPSVQTTFPQYYFPSEWGQFSAPQGPNTSAYHGHPDGHPPLVDNDLLSMLSTAPTGFELDEWGSYITSVDQIAHAQDTFGNNPWPQ